LKLTILKFLSSKNYATLIWAILYVTYVSPPNFRILCRTGFQLR